MGSNRSGSGPVNSSTLNQCKRELSQLARKLFCTNSCAGSNVHRCRQRAAAESTLWGPQIAVVAVVVVVVRPSRLHVKTRLGGSLGVYITWCHVIRYHVNIFAAENLHAECSQVAGYLFECSCIVSAHWQVSIFNVSEECALMEWGLIEDCDKHNQS